MPVHETSAPRIAADASRAIAGARNRCEGSGMWVLLLEALGAITRAGGICSVIVEQNAQKILGLADRVVILERGAIVHDAASSTLKADPAVLERFLGVSGAAAH